MRPPSKPIRNGRDLSRTKVQRGSWALVVQSKGRLVCPVRVWTWESRRGDGVGPVYATMRAAKGPTSLAGYGSATGYGYCKESAAIEKAFRSAGLTDFDDFAGCGIAAAESAMLGLCRSLGFRGKPYIVR